MNNNSKRVHIENRFVVNETTEWYIKKNRKKLIDGKTFNMSHTHWSVELTTRYQSAFCSTQIYLYMEKKETLLTTISKSKTTYFLFHEKRREKDGERKKKNQPIDNARLCKNVWGSFEIIWLLIIRSQTIRKLI